MPNLIRFYKRYANVTQQQTIGWRTYHSIHVALTRRLKDNVAKAGRALQGTRTPVYARSLEAAAALCHSESSVTHPPAPQVRTGKPLTGVPSIIA